MKEQTEQMTTFIAMLRGINVSGQKKVPMTDLKSLFEEMHFSDVQTYIQSGNVIFKTVSASANPVLEQKIERTVYNKFGFIVPVIIRTTEEMRKTISSNPFLNNPGTDPEKLHVTFLGEKPQTKQVSAFADVDFSPDKFLIIDREVYLYCPDGYGNTKLSNTFFERKLKVKATTRNWKTVNKLVEMGSVG